MRVNFKKLTDCFQFQSLTNLQKLNLSQSGLTCSNLQIFLEKVLAEDNLQQLKLLNLGNHFLMLCHLSE
jgi:hypothetical protein